MADVAARPGIGHNPTREGGQAPARTWARGPEVGAILQAHHARTHTGPRSRLYRSLMNHGIDMYDCLVRAAASSGQPADAQHIISSWQATRQLYDEPEGGWTNEALDARRHSPRRWIKMLAAAGLVEYEPMQDEETGLSIGWRYRLLPVEDALARLGLDPRRSSSVG